MRGRGQFMAASCSAWVLVNVVLALRHLKKRERGEGRQNNKTPRENCEHSGSRENNILASRDI